MTSTHRPPMTSTDRIEKTIILRAPRSGVWRALADSRAFGEWLGVALEQPFAPGATVRGKITYPGYEHLVLEMRVERMEAERLFSFRWHPNAHEPNRDYSTEPTTLVEFTLEDVPEGTRLTMVESGFDRIPLDRRNEAFRSNSGGWEEQMQNIERYVRANP
jgi:uncharacterized protein YndB with AHSA1/START domain